MTLKERDSGKKTRLSKFFRLFAQSLLTSSYGNNAYACLSIIRLDSDAHFVAGVREEKEKTAVNRKGSRLSQTVKKTEDV